MFARGINASTVLDRMIGEVREPVVGIVPVVEEDWRRTFLLRAYISDRWNVGWEARWPSVGLSLGSMGRWSRRGRRGLMFSIGGRMMLRIGIGLITRWRAGNRLRLISRWRTGDRLGLISRWRAGDGSRRSGGAGSWGL